MSEQVKISARADRNVWRLTTDGRVLGDSRGYDARQVRQAIDAYVLEVRGYRYPVDAVADYPESLT